MNLRRIDLNLLVAFDVLMRTRHVTRAASQLGMGQPGMSSALSRLRVLFADELLVKQGSQMQPTARAIELEPEVRRILQDVERLATETSRFDPATSRRTFRLRLSDLLSALLLPALMSRISAAAPGVRIEVSHLGPDATVDALERNTLDLAISTALRTPRSIELEALFADRIVTVLRREHPKRSSIGRLGVFVTVPQVKVAQSPIDDRFVDRQLAALGRDRLVALTVPHWLAVPAIVEATDLIAIMPRSIASTFEHDCEIALAEVPVPDVSFDWSVYWHRRHARDAALVWLRGRIGEAVAASGLSGPRYGRRK